jgi:hypothetical protein
VESNSKNPGSHLEWIVGLLARVPKPISASQRFSIFLVHEAFRVLLTGVAAIGADQRACHERTIVG